MRITFIGHAGLFIETARGSILCDPWFNPAYFGSWFPYPSNEDLDLSALANPDYLYVSHLHHDHYDPAFLREHVSKDTRVLLPDYPVEYLEKALEGVGFTNFVRTPNSEPVDLDGLRVMIVALTAPTDGPIGDSGLAVDDGTATIFNQNDSRPIELDPLTEFGPYDGHFLQFSGAIWYPMVYRFPDRMKQTVGRRKRVNGMSRAKRYVDDLGAAFVFPSAGPPAFLDDELFAFNDVDRDPANIFPDQTVFLEYLREQGLDNGRLMVPGTVVELRDGTCTVTHPVADAEVDSLFTDKRAHLERYAERKRPLLEDLKAGWPRGKVDVLPELKAWFEPLLEQADLTCAGVNGRVVLRTGEEDVVIDFLDRKVYAWEGQEARYRFTVDRALIEACIVHHEQDWINELFLSCRFAAEREGPYNEYVYNFFKCLSPERIQYAEGYYAEQSTGDDLMRVDGYLVQRRCPHLKADLTRFGEYADGILTCQMHGWQFDLASGRCLTTEDYRISATPVSDGAEVPAAAGPPVG